MDRAKFKDLARSKSAYCKLTAVFCVLCCLKSARAFFQFVVLCLPRSFFFEFQTKHEQSQDSVAGLLTSIAIGVLYRRRKDVLPFVKRNRQWLIVVAVLVVCVLCWLKFKPQANTAHDRDTIIGTNTVKDTEISEISDDCTHACLTEKLQKLAAPLFEPLLSDDQRILDGLLSCFCLVLLVVLFVSSCLFVSLFFWLLMCLLCS